MELDKMYKVYKTKIYLYKKNQKYGKRFQIKTTFSSFIMQSVQLKNDRFLIELKLNRIRI